MGWPGTRQMPWRRLRDTLSGRDTLSPRTELPGFGANDNPATSVGTGGPEHRARRVVSSEPIAPAVVNHLKLHVLDVLTFLQHDVLCEGLNGAKSQVEES
jgi:hypothetical protein